MVELSTFYERKKCLLVNSCEVGNLPVVTIDASLRMNAKTVPFH